MPCLDGQSGKASGGGQEEKGHGAGEGLEAGSRGLRGVAAGVWPGWGWQSVVLGWRVTKGCPKEPIQRKGESALISLTPLMSS